MMIVVDCNHMHDACRTYYNIVEVGVRVVCCYIKSARGKQVISHQHLLHLENNRTGNQQYIHETMESLPFSAMIIAATVALLLSFCGQSAGVFEPQDTTCGLEYQSTIMEAIEMRKQCNNAAFRDCCQVYY